MGNGDTIVQLITSPIFVIVGFYIMRNNKKIAEAFLASNKVFNEKMGWKWMPISDKLTKLNTIFLFIFGLIFFLAGLLGLYQGLAVLGLCPQFWR